MKASCLKVNRDALNWVSSLLCRPDSPVQGGGWCFGIFFSPKPSLNRTFGGEGGVSSQDKRGGLASGHAVGSLAKRHGGSVDEIEITYCLGGWMSLGRSCVMAVVGLAPNADRKKGNKQLEGQEEVGGFGDSSLVGCRVPVHRAVGRLSQTPQGWFIAGQRAGEVRQCGLGGVQMTRVNNVVRQKVCGQCGD